MHCLDTDVVLALLHGDEPLKSKVLAVSQHFNPLCIHPFVLVELFREAFGSLFQQQAVKVIEELSASVRILELTPDASRIFGKERARLSRQGISMHDVDLLVASIAVAHNAVLVTKHPHEYKGIQDLKVLAW